MYVSSAIPIIWKPPCHLIHCPTVGHMQSTVVQSTVLYIACTASASATGLLPP